MARTRSSEAALNATPNGAPNGTLHGSTDGAPNATPINGHPKRPARNVVEEKEDDQTDENIFIFVPNLIGTLQRTS